MTETFHTGAKRSEVMPRFDLITKELYYRLAQRATGKLRQNGEAVGGALQYGEGNWERGLPTSDVLNHVLNHITTWAEHFRRYLTASGELEDDMQTWQERMDWVQNNMRRMSEIEDDLAGAVWGIMVLMQQEMDGFHHDRRFEDGPLEVQHAPDPVQGGNLRPGRRGNDSDDQRARTRSAD